MALSDLEGLKNHLGIPDTDPSEDVLLGQLIRQVGDCVKNYVGLALEAATYTEYYDGTGRPTLRLNQRPVRSVTSVYYDPTGYYGQGPNAFAAATLLAAGTDYVLRPDQPDGSSRSGLLWRINGFWSGRAKHAAGLLSYTAAPGLGNVKVTYAGGYADTPTDLTLAVNEVVAGVRRSAKYGPGLVQTSESVEDYSYTLAELFKIAKDYPGIGTAAQILGRYRAMGLKP